MLRIVPVGLLLATLVIAQDPEVRFLEGHSHHGQAFNEGPRQAAYLMDGMNPAVHFAVSTSNAEAQRFFDQGIVQMHGFWYFEAERSFRQVLQLDPQCVMAYWGLVLANIENEARAHAFAREAYERRESVTPKERALIEAYARYYDATKALPDGTQYEEPKGDKDVARRNKLIEDYEAVLDDHPDDVEVLALFINQLWIDSRDAGQRIRARQANQAMLGQVFAAVPMHPAHHYRVHLWDTKNTAARAIDSAAVIGHAAPGIAHMWHMGGHLFAQLDRHDDAAWQQEASARVDHAYMMRDWVMPDQIHNYAHNNEWLSRSLRHVGRVHESIDLAKNMVELPRHPKWNVPTKGSTSSRWGPLRLQETLETFEAWDELVALAGTQYLDPGDEPARRAEFDALLGRAHLGRGFSPLAAAQLAKLDEQLAAARAKRAAAFDAAETDALDAGKSDADTTNATAEATKTPTQDVRSVKRARDALAARIACAEGDFDRGLAGLERAKVDKTEIALAYLAAGRGDDAEKAARDAAKSPGRAQPLATLAYVLHVLGKRDEAHAEFAKLRALSAHFDLDYAPFARLAPLVAELGLPADWRIADEPRPDTGVRPPLAELGPFRWSPVQAPDWRAKTGAGTEVGLADYAGRPVLVVFFLGFGCVHCVEQLQALQPMTARFAAAGISVVAIGTDTVDELVESERATPEAERYRFPIAADPEQQLFRRYRCRDDFEQLPLHGTFLIDGQGRVRWQDIGFEPFMDLEFLLRESQRLLALPIGEAPARPR